MSAEEVVQDVSFVDDDDDMPPLVDNPYPATSMTFTFAANMTPIAYGTDANSLEIPPQPAPRSFIYTPDPEPELEPPTTTSHSRKKDKDANYIPRPPNAFILFRSSFIKAQHIPEKIEGNHSSLSKIIGKYWKTLSPEQKQVWEAKAIVALADHRKKYPDWRFRTTSNALTKVKDGPKRKNNKKARGEVDKKVKDREKRCDRIADLLAAGKTGADLEKAIQKFDHEVEDGPKVKDEGCGVFAARPQESVPPPETGNVSNDVGEVREPARREEPFDASCPTSLPEAHEFSHDLSNPRFCTPLTSMFRRASSAPAAHARPAVGDTGFHHAPFLGRRESVGAFTPYSDPRLPSAVPGDVGHGAGTRVEGQDDAALNVAAMRQSDWNYQPSSFAFLPPPNSTDYGYSGWEETLPSPSYGSEVHSPHPAPSENDGDDYSSPVHSPMSSAFDMVSDADAASVYSERVSDFPDAQHSHRFPLCPAQKPWACDGEAAGLPIGHNPFAGPFVVTPQTPSMYDPEGIMQNAFEAASYAHLGAWDLGFSPVQASQARGTDSWECLPEYSRCAQAFACRPGDDVQLSNYLPLPVN
ncbi:HMG domain-containing protein [Phanerochaete sordida]|uniref:HMG domain-containing protein n=1 Tax=Phanerochaete sordida TaxID=48140 RepID=A0A9P3FZH5_9APHY|nr:HMG domain-containing protein [Phanerochaete sordida]